MLAVNNEPCGANGVGGFDLYDVTDPANPETLVQGAGDQSPDHDDGSRSRRSTQDPRGARTAPTRSSSGRTAPSAYAVIVDNTELSDVDIFDITDPTQPVFIADLDLFELAVDRGHRR